MKQISLQDLKYQVKMSTLDELGYLLGRYCGPHNVILCAKMYDRDACKEIQRIVADEILMRQMDDILLSDD
jgi:hypothetical protein